MAAEEEKETEQELVDQGSEAQEPAEQEPVEQEPTEEDKKKKYWWLSLGLVFLLLAGGGFYALTGMRQAAHKLGGGSDYDQLSANSTVYDGGAGAAKKGNYFPQDEESGSPAADGAKADRVNSSLIRSPEELVADSSGKKTPPSAAAVDSGEESSSAETPGAGPGVQAAMADKLQARSSAYGGASGAKGARKTTAASAGGVADFQGNSTLVGRASAQRETNKSDPKQAGRSSVMQSLKGSFKASFHGARLSSKDSARGWIARTFDGAAEPTTAIEYEENLRKLDKVNPDSIPGFLREQDVSAAEAKRLTVSEVANPKIDKDSTKEALAADKDYQAKKMAGDFSGGMINGLFKGLPGTDPPVNEDPAGPQSFADPEDKPDIVAAGLADFVETNGNGEECGCSAAAPCCCLPQNSVTQNCPVYGPFLPNDPCAAGMYGDSGSGSGAGTDGSIMAGN